MNQPRHQSSSNDHSRCDRHENKNLNRIDGRTSSYFPPITSLASGVTASSSGHDNNSSGIVQQDTNDMCLSDNLCSESRQQQQQQQPTHTYSMQQNVQESFFLDNIIVGYAFGPKKMETMGLIMAEASKALPTFETSAMSVGALSAMIDGEQHHQSESMDLCEESSMATTAATTGVTGEECFDLGDRESTAHAACDLSDEEDRRSWSSTRSSAAYSLRSQRGGGNGNGAGGIQLTFLPDSSGYVHLVRTSSSGSGFEGEQSVAGSSVTTIATSSTPFRKQGGSSSSTSIKLDKGQEADLGTCLNSIGFSVKGCRAEGGNKGFEQNSCSLSSPVSRERCSSRGGLRRHPIRVSFVPIDLDTPLEEQHGGKFDVILHKMTEDILCMSKMFRSHQQSKINFPVEEGGEIMDGINSNLNQSDSNLLLSLRSKESNDPPIARTSSMDSLTLNPFASESFPSESQMSRHQKRAARRIQRLHEYKDKIHPSCVLVDSPNNVLAVMSRADMAEVLSCCLAGITTTGGIPVRTPRFRVVDEDEEMLASATENNKCGESQMNHPLSLADEIEKEGFQYPIIAKPLTAAGTKSSHHMGIVMARDGLRRLKTPCLLQEYANHGGRLFKVYVLGDSVWVFSRESLPNLPLGERDIKCDDTHGNSNFSAERTNGIRSKEESYVEFERPAGSRFYVEFNSQQPYPKLSDFGLADGHASSPCVDALNQGHHSGDYRMADSCQNIVPCVSGGSDVHRSPSHKKQRLDCYTVESSNKKMIRQHKQLDTNNHSANVDDCDKLSKYVTVDEIRPVTNALRNAFGLELFGFDVIVKHTSTQRFRDLNVEKETDIQNKEILVVDVNYFPGYKEVSNFPSLLAQFLTQKAVESRVRNME